MSFALSVTVLTRINRLIPTSRMQIGLLLTLGFLFFSLSLITTGIINFQKEVILGCILSTANAFLGYSFLERAFRIESNMFIIISLAGMAFRFFLVIVTISLILLLTTTGVAGFIGAFMVSYTAYMFAEVFYINRKTDQMKLAKVPIR